MCGGHKEAENYSKCVRACVGLERLRVRLSGDVFSDLSVPCWRMFIFSCMIVALKLFD